MLEDQVAVIAEERVPVFSVTFGIPPLDGLRAAGTMIIGTATTTEEAVALEDAGVEVVGPTDHGICQSIYFYDPSGHRLEMAVRTEEPGIWDRSAAEAPERLEEWNALKKQHAKAAE